MYNPVCVHTYLRVCTFSAVFLAAAKSRTLELYSLYTPKESRSIKTAIFTES
jgi:hypothetical protein